MLSGIVSKAAAYGFLRIAIAKFPGPTQDFRTPLLVLAAVGLVYGSLLAFRAPDVRGVIAYSSLAQMGLITLGLFAANDLGFNGAVLQMVEPRAHLRDAVPARRRDRAAHGDGRVPAARRDGARAARARDAADDDGRDRARGARLERVRRRVPRARGRLPAVLALRASSARSRSCSPRCTCCA